MEQVLRFLPLYVLFALLAGTLLPRLLQPVAGAILALGLPLFLVPPADAASALQRWLETRYDRSAVDRIADPAGIIVAGGGLATFVVARHQGESLDDRGRGGRISGAVALARRFPDARVVHTGREEIAARDVFVSLGVAPERLVIEDRSASTAENAAFAAALLQPRPDQRWILVTSAMHMPRAMATFRTAGFRVVAYPVDYRTGTAQAGDAGSPSRRSPPVPTPPGTLGQASREILAIAGYVLSGRIYPWYLLP